MKPNRSSCKGVACNAPTKLTLLLLIIGGIAFSETEQRFDFRIKVANTDSVFQNIIEFAEKKGGYFTNFDGYNISIRLPVKDLEEFNTTLAGLAQIEEKGFNSTDKSADLERLDSQIQSRKKLLESYLALVKTAPFSELQSVEREMVNLNAQIEHLQGQKQAIEKRAALSLITIHAYNQSQPTPPDNKHSPFEWINQTNLNSLQRDF